MNKYLKIINIFSIVSILTVIIVWRSHGAEILTKTKVLVDKSTDLDKMLGVKNEIWMDKFILGLDYSLIIIGLIFLITFGLNYILKTKQKGTK